MGEDHRLIRKILDGDKGAFEQLVRKHYANVYAYCRRRVWNESTAADLTQDIFLKLVSSIYRYKFSGKFSNFLFTITVNTCNDYFRKHQQEQTCELQELPENAKSMADTVIENEENALLYQRLSSLPEMQKQALILYYYHGLKAKDIAKITGVPLSTTKSRIKQGLDKLRKLYGKDESDEELSCKK